VLTRRTLIVRRCGGGVGHAAESSVVSPPPEEPSDRGVDRSRACGVFPQTQASLETVLVTPLPQGPLETEFIETLPGDLLRAPSC